MINFLDKIIYFLLLMIVFIFQTYLLRFEIFNIPTTFIELCIYFTLSLYIILIFIDNKKEKLGKIREIFYQNKPLFFGISIFIIGAFVSSMFSSDTRISFGIFKAYFIDPLLLFIIFISIVSENRIKYFILSFVFSGIFISIISIVYLLLGKVTYDNRLESFFNSPNFLAMTLAPVILAIISILLNSKKYKRLNLFLLGSLIIVFIPFILTYSYGAILGLFIAIFFSISLSLKSTKFKIMLSLMILILSLIIFYFQLGDKKTQDIIFNDQRSSIASREMIFESSLLILKDNYIFGIGPGMFQEYYLNYQNKFKEPYLEWAVPYPHNIFLAFWIQNGIFGLAGFLIILISVFSDSIKLVRRSQPSFTASVGLFVSSFFIYFSIHGIVDTPFWKNDLALTFFLFLGVVLILKSELLNSRSSKF
ncbi:MAG: O-antigen ligase family protein [Patescibacteria group bacterium]